MENFTLEEVKILLSSFKKHGLDLLTDRIQRRGSEDNAERYVTKDVRDLILYEKLLEKLSRYVTNETKNQKKLKKWAIQKGESSEQHIHFSSVSYLISKEC